MIPRYAHPLVDELWSPKWTYQTWLHIETLVLAAQLQHQVVPSGAHALMARLVNNKPTIDAETVDEILAVEQETRHDVVAFLSWLRGEAGPAARFLHYGLTSSDIVDTTMGLRFATLLPQLRDDLLELFSQFTRWSNDKTPILGRTHGNVAEPMEVRARACHWSTLVSMVGRDLLVNTRRLKICKLSGPVGTYTHNPIEVEVSVAMDLGLRPMGAGASQIVPRSALAAWASSASGTVEALAKVATDIRLMNVLGEAVVPTAEGQVGSSAMPHKQNPIVAEQVCGLAQIARGYALMLQPIAGWLERDIAHSSVERIAVPSLWHILLRAIKQTTDLLRETRIDQWAIAEDYSRAGNKPLTVVNTLAAINTGDSVEQARRHAMGSKDKVHPDDAALFMRNYPSDEGR